MAVEARFFCRADMQADCPGHYLPQSGYACDIRAPHRQNYDAFFGLLDCRHAGAELLANQFHQLFQGQVLWHLLDIGKPDVFYLA